MKCFKLRFSFQRYKNKSAKETTVRCGNVQNCRCLSMIQEQTQYLSENPHHESRVHFLRRVGAQI